MTDAVHDPIKGARHETFAGMEIDVMEAGPVRIKRLVYGVGGRWSVDVKPHVDTELCMHAHVGYIAQGTLACEYPDGCTAEFTAPAAVYIEPGHDSWVVGDEPVVLIQMDMADHTLDHLGIPDRHRHD